MTKKLFVIPLVFLLLFTLSACGYKDVTQDQQKSQKNGWDVTKLTVPGTQDKPSSVAPSVDEAVAIEDEENINNNENMNDVDLSSVDLTADANGLSAATVVIEMQNGGVVKYKFYSDDAPNHSKRMAELISSGFYNGLKFHRVVPGFVAQGGDPSGNGTGGSGKNIDAEFNSRKHLKGTVAMARSMDPNSGDSQFYICLEPQPSLDGNYTVFGQVIEGMEIVDKVQVGDVMKKVYFE